MEFDFIVIAPLLPSCCGFLFVFGHRVSFLVGSSQFLSMVVQQLVVILVFPQEGVSSPPSIPPSFLLLNHKFLQLCMNVYHVQSAKKKFCAHSIQNKKGEIKV